MAIKNRKIVLNARPEGNIKATDFKYIEAGVRDLEEGELLIENKYISADPAMRGWMNAGTTYIKGVEIGAVMRAFAIGHVLESMHPDYKAGDTVAGLLGVQSHVIHRGKGLQRVTQQDEPLSWHLGALGMPGMTAYFGLLERGKPQKGDTVLVSGAAGIVGSTVGQIARIKGCKVIGTAGSSAKCDYLVNECGFDHAINYKEENVAHALKEIAPNGVDIYYDNVGGPLLDTALANLAKGARVVICGAISQYNATNFYGPKNYMKIVTARGTMTGIIVFDFMDQYPTAVRDITGWLNTDKMKTKEHIVDGIENFPKALGMLFTGENFGKVLVKV